MSLLFTPGKIGTLEINNRMVRSATAERLAQEDGAATPRLATMWAALARGGVGLIISGHLYVHPGGKCHPEMTGIYDDQLVPGLAQAVAQVHAEGGKIVAQINHGGMQCSRETVQGTVAPSAIDREFLTQPARELMEDEIWDVIDAYAQAARRVKEAGFDGVQLHGAHGYLINQFISPYANRRTDGWGGDLVGRTRFLREVARQVRAAIGPDYPLLIKFGMQDGVQGGLQADEGAQVVAMMAEMGLDGVEISGGLRAENTKKGIKSPEREAYFKPLAKLAKAATHLPVILVGGMRSRAVMEGVLAASEADFVALCRPLINDPDFPRKLQAGELERSGCISSNNCWPLKDGEGIACKCPKGYDVEG
jgi:2,4-dienoyl-CoA reductase-like NADH-dependent reductase (Old Yellow Enzyme family)